MVVSGYVNTGDVVSSVGSSHDTITLGNGAGDTVTADAGSYNTITIGSGDGDKVSASGGGNEFNRGWQRRW